MRAVRLIATTLFVFSLFLAAYAAIGLLIDKGLLGAAAQVACTRGGVDIGSIAWRDGALSWCESAELPTTRIVRTLYVDGAARAELLDVTCTLAGADRACRGRPDAAAIARLQVPGAHTIRMSLSERNVTTGVLLEHPRTPELQVLAGGCDYGPSGGAVGRRAIGDTLQGINGEAGQAVRIQQLRSWGWRVEWDWDGAARRVLVMAWCTGTPQ